MEIHARLCGLVKALPAFDEGDTMVDPVWTVQRCGCWLSVVFSRVGLLTGAAELVHRHLVYDFGTKQYVCRDYLDYEVPPARLETPDEWLLADYCRRTPAAGDFWRDLQLPVGLPRGDDLESVVAASTQSEFAFPEAVVDEGALDVALFDSPVPPHKFVWCGVELEAESALAKPKRAAILAHCGGTEAGVAAFRAAFLAERQARVPVSVPVSVPALAAVVKTQVQKQVPADPLRFRRVVAELSSGPLSRPSRPVLTRQGKIKRSS